MNDMIKDIAIVFIPGILSLLSIPITYLFNNFSNKNLDSETKIKYQKMLDYVYSPLFDLIHSRNIKKNSKDLNNFIYLLNILYLQYPLFLDSDTIVLLYEYNQTHKIKHKWFNLTKEYNRINRQYEFLRFKLSYPSSYVFKKSMNIVFIIIFFSTIIIGYYNFSLITPWAIISFIVFFFVFIIIDSLR